MSRRHRPPKFAYLDTNFYSYLLKKRELADRAVAYLRREGFTVIISLLHWAELHKADRQHDVISRFWDDVDAMLVVPSGHTNYFALDAYPGAKRTPPKIIGPTCEDVARDFLAGVPVDGSVPGYSAALLNDLLDKQKPRARAAIEEIRMRWPNATKRRDFEDRWIFQALLFTSRTRFHPNFITLNFPLVPGSFPSVRLQGALVWWTHIRPGARPPRLESSELADRAHSEYFYCCELIVLEAFQHEMLSQVRRAAPELFKQTLRTFTTSKFVQLLETAAMPFP